MGLDTIKINLVMSSTNKILSLVLGIEPFETFVVVGGGWYKVILV